jgi:hypothetical protein
MIGSPHHVFGRSDAGYPSVVVGTLDDVPNQLGERHEVDDLAVVNIRAGDLDVTVGRLLLNDLQRR